MKCKLFTRKGCPKCDEWKKELSKARVDLKIVDVTKSADGLAEMSFLGLCAVPSFEIVTFKGRSYTVIGEDQFIDFLEMLKIPIEEVM